MVVLKKAVPDKNPNEVSRQARELYERGVTSLERNVLDAANHYLSECLALEPGFLKARQTLRVVQTKKCSSGGSVSRIFGSVTGSPALAKAMIHLKKDPSKSMAEAEKALSSNPNNVQALRLVSQAAELLDFPLTAVFCYETAREAYPENVEILMELGRLYQQSDQADKGRECYERVLQLEPANNEAFKGLKDAIANAAMRKGKWDSDSDYRGKLKDEKEAQSLEQSGRIVKDVDVVHAQMNEIFKLTQEQPQNVSHWKKLGDLALQVDEFDYAIQCYEHAFELTGKSDVGLEKNLSAIRQKKMAKVICAKEEQMAADPANTALVAELEALKAERDKMLLEECENRARRYPNDLDIKCELAQIYFRQGLVDKAIREFQLAANSPKLKPFCTFWLGRCFCQKEMFDMAVQRYKAAVELMPLLDGLKKDVLYELGIAFEKMGSVAEAIEQFKLIYDTDVGYRDVSQRIEAFYKKQSAAKA